MNIPYADTARGLAARDMRIAELEAALVHVVDVLDSPAYRAWMERVAAVDLTLLSEGMPRVDMRRLRALQTGG